MPKIKIDNVEVEFTQGMTIIQACDAAGIEIPRFCYHKKLSVAGNCRMCLVEVKPGPPKPAASCAMPCSENMEVFTKSAMVKKAREGAMEFLLVNHPLDCPICDQAGECDLQDISRSYGSCKGRYSEGIKRSVEDKYMGALIKTNMTRCINCTRCVRFAEEIAGIPELGVTGRGIHSEITTYVEKTITSELSANMIDLCPVGALTSAPYAFKARPWELKKTASIDIMDAVGSNIQIESKNEEILRINPRINEKINEEWITDKARFSFDGLSHQRLDIPYIRINGKLQETSWDKAVSLIKEKLTTINANNIAALAGSFACVESMFALKNLLNILGSNNTECRINGEKFDATDRASYLFNTEIADIENADLILLVGTNPKLEAPLINTRIRKAVKNGAKIYNIGNIYDSTYVIQQLGNNPQILNEIAEGNHELAEAIKNSENPIIILGNAAVARSDGRAIINSAKYLASHSNIGQKGFNILHNTASMVGGLDINFTTSKNLYDGIRVGEIKLVYLLGVDDIDMDLLGDSFIIYQGFIGDVGANRADIILPSAAYTEKCATFVNIEGRTQCTLQAVQPIGEAKIDWRIIKAIANAMDINLGFETKDELQKLIINNYPHLGKIGEISPAEWMEVDILPKDISDIPFTNIIDNYYITDAISRNSEIMAEVSRVILNLNKVA